MIEATFTASGGTYGSPRITRDLHEAGWRVSENTVAGRMAELGLAGRAARRRRSLTRQGKRPAAPELVSRNFTAVAPDVLWCGDVTEMATDEGKLYLAMVEDLFSCRLLGYAMSEHHDAALTIASLQTAAVTCGGTVEGMIFHTDPEEYSAARFQAARRHWASCSRWAGSAAPWTTPPSRSTPPSKSNASTGAASPRGPKPA
ncbi:IS3 family transposase [Nonomuraea sp. NPDC004702]